MALLAGKMAPKGTLEVRTDDADYHEQMLEVLEAEPTLENRAGRGRTLTEPLDPHHHTPTLFESKFRDQGRTIHYLYYRKVASADD